MAGKNAEDKDLNKVQGGIMSHMGIAVAYGGPDFRLPKDLDVASYRRTTRMKTNTMKDDQGDSNIAFISKNEEQ